MITIEPKISCSVEMILFSRIMVALIEIMSVIVIDFIPTNFLTFGFSTFHLKLQPRSLSSFVMLRVTEPTESRIVHTLFVQCCWVWRD